MPLRDASIVAAAVDLLQRWRTSPAPPATAQPSQHQGRAGLKASAPAPAAKPGATGMLGARARALAEPPGAAASAPALKPSRAAAAGQRVSNYK